MDLSSSKDGESHRTESACGSLLSGRSKSRNGGCALSEYSKPYVLFSATDAASAAIDFSRKSMDDGVVDSPPSRGLRGRQFSRPRPWKACSALKAGIVLLPQGRLLQERHIDNFTSVSWTMFL